MSRKKLYLLILCFAFAGCFWVILNHYLLNVDLHTPDVCLFRQVTGIPCPSCGTTHAVLSIMKGHFLQAMSENILGFPVALMMMVFPVWIAIDLIRRRESFYTFYLFAESILRKSWVAWPALGLLLINWGYHIIRIV
jgi:hypothetical protein